MRIAISTIACLVFLAGCTKSPYEPEPEPADIWHLLLLTEIVSNNDTTYSDEFGEFDDYVEIYNPQDTAISLSSFGLTDDPGEPLKYEFPAGFVIESDSLIIIWCDGEPEQGNLHADFRISSLGEFIGLFAGNDGVVDSVTVPELEPDEAYIRIGNEWHIGEPSPGNH